MSVLLENLGLNSKHRQDKSRMKGKRFPSTKLKSHNDMSEQKALISVETESSDEEVTLHDIRYLKKESDENNENFSLRKIKKCDLSKSNGYATEEKIPDPFQNCEFLYYNIESEDTLQSISIKYHCPVSDIKRANNLIKDQEFYGLKILKIPVKKFSLLTEVLTDSPEVNSNSIIVEEPDTDVQTISIAIGSTGRSPSPQDTAAFFKRMDEDLVKIMLSTNSQKDSLEAATAVLTAPQIQPLVKDPYNTVDCGIQYNYLIVFVIMFAIVVPAMIALYIYTRIPHEHNEGYHESVANEPFNHKMKLNIESGS